MRIKKEQWWLGLIAVLVLVSGALATKQFLASDATFRSDNIARQTNTQAKVPFLGPFAYHEKGMQQCGPAVRLMEGALRRTTPPVRTTVARNCVGLATKRQIIRFQHRHGIPGTGIYGGRTHAALSHAYSRTQIRDLVYLADARRRALRVQAILTVTSHAYALRGLMGYCDYGSLAQCSHRGDWPAYPDVPRHTDCSGYVSWVYYQAGLRNPNGSGVGSTHTLINYGQNVGTGARLHVGDLIFYGSNTHVAIYVGHGLVSSHGKPGLDIHAYAYRPIYAIHRYFQ